MSKKKKILKVLIALFVLIIGISANILGKNLRESGFNKNVLFKVITVVAITVVFIYFANLIIKAIMQKKRFDSESFEDKLFEKKKLAEENYLQYFKKVKFNIFLSTLYFAFVNILLLSMYILFCLAVNGIHIYVFIITGLLFYKTFTYLIGEDVKDALNNEIKKDEYPRLWELVTNVASKFDIKKKIRVYLIYDNNAGVLENSKYCEIVLGIQLVFLLNEEELANILTHEFAHVYLNHTSKTYSLNRGIERWKNLKETNNNIFDKFSGILYYPITIMMYYNYEVFQMVSSRVKETETDNLVIEKGDKQIYINALAKTSIYNFFLYDECYRTTDIYHKESILDDYFSVLYKIFMKFYDRDKEIMEEIITKRIPARIDTHYPFKYRMDLLGVDDFEVLFSKQIPEIEKLINHANALIQEDFKGEYNRARHENYSKHLEIITKFESGEKEFNSLELFDCAYSYRMLGKLDKAMEIYNLLIEDNNDSPKLNIAKGSLLLSFFDNSGIDLIYKAMELNDKYLKEGIEIISEYCLKMGLEEELEKIRAYLKKHRDFIINIQPKTQRVNVKDKFLKTDLSDAAIGEIVNFISRDLKTARVYIVDKIVDKNYRMHIVGLLIKPEFKNELGDSLDEIYEYLDNNRRENFFLLSLNHYPIFIKKCMGIPMSLKYQSK